MDLTEKQFSEVLEEIKRHIELPNKHSCRVGWAVVKIAGQRFKTSYQNFDKIADAVIESGEYAKYRPSDNDKDWNIRKNSEYKLAQINKKSIIINTIISFLTFLALIASIIITQQAYKAGQSFEQKVEHRLNSFSKKEKEESPSTDSLSSDKRDSVYLKRK